jgi:hypothetical protein
MMENLIKVVRGPNCDYLILDANKGEVGRANRCRNGFNVFLSDIYWHQGKPNRRGGGSCAFVYRLKDVPDFTTRTLVEIEVIDIHAAAIKKALLSSLVDVDVNQSVGSVLSWLVAKALKLEVDIDFRGRYVALVDRSTFTPLEDLTLAIDIMNKHVQTINNLFTEKFEAVGYVTGAVGYGETIQLAGLRCFVVSQLGQRVRVPACLLN